MRRHEHDTKPLDAFIQRKAEIDGALARIQILSDEHLTFIPARSKSPPSEGSLPAPARREAGSGS